MAKMIFINLPIGDLACATAFAAAKVARSATADA
jgi:hypothetical protein